MISDQDYTNGIKYVPVDVTIYPTGVVYTLPFNWIWWSQKGWECPKCGRCYSPTTNMCPFCGKIESKATE